MPVRWYASSPAIRKEKLEHDDIMPVVMARISMGKQKVGALIVIEHNLPLDDVVRTGEIINADINQRLIENIFFKNSPLHNGAMVISKKRTQSGGMYPACLPHNLDIPKELGLRHRAAMGISQVSDAHAIIVGGDRRHFSGLQRTILPASECRGIGKFVNKGKLRCDKISYFHVI